VKAGGMRVSKKQENGPVEKNAKPPGKEKRRYRKSCTLSQLFFFFSPPLMLQMSHKIHAAALQVAQQKPQPALEKFMLPK
ncbi:DAL1B protein, partial [Brachypteracias leptosomus]|nr:DAL1B protein [Brachypteracias leptosomus]